MRPVRALAAAAAAAVMLAGCAAAGPDTHVWESAYDYGKPGQVVLVQARVPYYPACKNEILNVGGRTWFPYTPSNADQLPVDPLAEAPTTAADSVAAGAHGAAVEPVGAVVAPSPGDDVGTLVIYEGDLAYWESDSGKFHTWLTNHKIEYNWAC